MGIYKIKMKFLLLILATLLVVIDAKSKAYCRRDLKGAMRDWPKIDANHDGHMTRGEAYRFFLSHVPRKQRTKKVRARVAVMMRKIWKHYFGKAKTVSKKFFRGSVWRACRN